MNKPVTAEDIMAQSRREVSSQATSIEQSRAIAEVQAAVTVAQKCPRDEPRALEKALASCRTWEVAEDAFYKFPRGGENVQGETIGMAVELARCWGNISYGVMELDRDDDRKMSEMLAYAWDLETNTQSRTTFLVPHRRDTRRGTVDIVDMRDIYENNANNGSRRLRECIFRVLPRYLKEAAKRTAFETLQKGEGDKPLQVRVTEAVAAFEEIGVSRDRLESKLGRSGTWSAIDVANLQVSYRSIKRNEVNAETEFPRAGVDETTAAARRIAADQKSDAPQHEPEGRADSEMGEAHNGADEALDSSIEAVTARNISAQAHAVIDQQGLDEVEALAAKHRAAINGYDPTLMTFVDASIDAAEQRLQSKEN